MRFYNRESEIDILRENEIDMIALNEFNHSGIAAEIKRNPRKLSLTELERKVSNLPSSDFGCYNLTLQTLSIEDLKK